MFAFIRNFIREYREFSRTTRALAVVLKDVRPMPIADVYALAAVAAELGVGAKEAKDGTWRQRFSVVDE